MDETPNSIWTLAPAEPAAMDKCGNMESSDSEVLTKRRAAPALASPGGPALTNRPSFPFEIHDLTRERKIIA